MALPRGIRRLLALRVRKPLEDEERVDLEFRHHLEMRIDELVAQGHSPLEARRIAEEGFGDAPTHRAACIAERRRAARMTRWREEIFVAVGELRRAIKTLFHAPGFTLTLVLSLALGIGATSTVFAFTDAVLLRPLPYPEADRLVAIGHEVAGTSAVQAGQSDGSYLHYSANSRAFEGIAVYYENVVNLSGSDGGAPERVPIAMVSHTFFSVLRAKVAVGRLPTAEDVTMDAGRLRNAGDLADTVPATAGPAVLLSYDLWQRRYGSDHDIVGQTIEANRVLRTVIGVLEPGFEFPHPGIGIWYLEDPDPATARASDMFKESIGRLRPGVTPQDAERDLNRLIASLPDAFPDLGRQVIEDTHLRAVVTPLKDKIVGQAGGALWLLLGGMAVLLLIACVNVANLLLIRGDHRQRDVAVRRALGAGRGDLIRYVGAEAAVLAGLGWAAGVALAVVGVHAMVTLIPGSLPRLSEVGVGAPVVLFAAGLSLVVGILLALVSLARRTGSGITSTLRDGGARTTEGPMRLGVRRALVTGQVALALTLLIGSALMTRSFWRLHTTDLGFDDEGVLTLEIAMPRTGYETYESARRLWDALVERVHGLPGVESAGVVTGLPLVPKPAYYNLAIEVEGKSNAPYAGQTSSYYSVTADYFNAMHIPLLEGERVNAGNPEAERPVLLSLAASRRLFGADEPIGRHVRRTVGPGPWLTVVGVVGDVPAEQVGGPPIDALYVPLLETAVDPLFVPTQGTLVVRGTAPASLTPAIRRILSELDPNLPIASVRIMKRIVADSMARTSFLMILLLAAAGSALFLGVVGVYGVVSYAVGRRTPEIGLRVALGARPPDVRRMILVENAGLILGGVVLGLAASLGLSRFMNSLLYEVRPADLVSYAGTATLLVCVALLSTWVPARRASRVDPREALRGD